jgi:predicted dehydrogenase
MDLKILIIGLGSMGKRRIRNLMALGHEKISGFDINSARRNGAAEKYSIKTFASFEEAVNQTQANTFIISVPPDMHHVYMKYAVEHNISSFIEASVVDYGFDEIIKLAKARGTLLCPSCTLYFHPAIKKIKEVIEKGSLGNLSNILYHSGQYLPDWHTYESVSDYYVSKKNTGGAREIVPFELSWLVKIFGFPRMVSGMYKKTINIEGAEDIDDTYNALFDFGQFMMTMTIDVVSRTATRRLTINGDKKQLHWDWDNDLIKIYDPAINKWEEYPYETLAAESGYNKNITEQMYLDEIQCFLNAISGNSLFVNSLENDHKILKLLYAIERSSDLMKFISFPMNSPKL